MSGDNFPPSNSTLSTAQRTPMDPTEEVNIASVTRDIRQLRRRDDGAVGEDTALNRQLSAARTAMNLTDTTAFMDQPSRISDQMFIVSELQRPCIPRPRQWLCSRHRGMVCRTMAAHSTNTAQIASEALQGV